jgi:hypothetical protein
LALIESFFKEVLLLDEDNFSSADQENGSNTFSLQYQNTQVFFYQTELNQERTPFLIQLEEDQWEEIQQRVEFWQYRHRPSLEEFELFFKEEYGCLNDTNGQQIILLKNYADSFLSSLNTTQAQL